MCAYKCTNIHNYRHICTNIYYSYIYMKVFFIQWYLYICMNVCLSQVQTKNKCVCNTPEYLCCGFWLVFALSPPWGRWWRICIYIFATTVGPLPGVQHFCYNAQHVPLGGEGPWPSLPLPPQLLPYYLLFKTKHVANPQLVRQVPLTASASGSRLQLRRRCLACSCTLAQVHPPIHSGRAKIHTCTRINI